MENKKERVLYIDAARTAAIVFVALNHAVNRTWINYGEVVWDYTHTGPVSTGLKAMLTVASRYGVPLFLMITGALILRRGFDSREQIRSFFRRNWRSLFITSEIWIFFGFWFHVLVKPKPFLADAALWEKLWRCLKTLLFLDMIRFDSMWYVPMILSIYTVLPILAVFLHRSAAPKLILLPLAGVFLCDMLVPTVNACLAIFGLKTLNFMIYDTNFLSAYLIYVLAGYWVSTGGLERLSDRAVIAGAVGSCLLCCAVQFWCYTRSDHLLAYMSPGILFSSFFVFECFRRYSGCLRRFARPLAAVSRSAFALYLMHVFFLWGFHWYFDFSGWSHTAKVLFLTVVPLAASGLIIRLLSPIPWCRKTLFLIK